MAGSGSVWTYYSGIKCGVDNYSVGCTAMNLLYTGLVAELVELFHDDAVNLHVKVFVGGWRNCPRVVFAIHLKAVETDALMLSSVYAVCGSNIRHLMVHFAL